MASVSVPSSAISMILTARQAAASEIVRMAEATAGTRNAFSAVTATLLAVGPPSPSVSRICSSVWALRSKRMKLPIRICKVMPYAGLDHVMV
jgi:hypothetical protein